MLECRVEWSCQKWVFFVEPHVSNAKLKIHFLLCQKDNWNNLPTANQISFAGSHRFGTQNLKLHQRFPRSRDKNLFCGKLFLPFPNICLLLNAVQKNFFFNFHLPPDILTNDLPSENFSVVVRGFDETFVSKAYFDGNKFGSAYLSGEKLLNV